MAKASHSAAETAPRRPPGKGRGFPWSGILLVLVTALAAAVRCLTLSAQSLWLDEVSTTVEAGRPLSSLFLSLFDPHQGYPLYILGMRFWTALFGSSEAALRWPSAIAGLGAVPLLYLLGQRLFNRAIGLLAALFFALSPLAVWYSQEAKAYAIVLLLTVASWLVLWEAVERRARWPWWAFGLLAILSLLAHRLIAVLSLIGQLSYVVYVAQQGRFTVRHRRLLVGLLLAVLLATLAGLWLVLGQGGAARQFGTRRDWTAPLDAFSQFSLRITPRPPDLGRGPDRRPWLLAFGIVALAGIIGLVRDVRRAGRSRRPAVFLLSFLLAPPLAFFLFYLLVGPFYYERYLLGALPAYLLLLAVGIATLWRWAGDLARAGERPPAIALGTLAVAAVAVLLATSWREVQTYNLSRQPHKEQFREATRYLQEHLHPGDVVVIHPNYIAPAVEYYRARLPRVPLELHMIRDLLTQDYREQDFEADMTDLTTGRRRAWLLLAPSHARFTDPNHWVYNWFYLNPFLHCDERHFTGIDLYCVSFNEQRKTGFPTPTILLRETFGQELLLFGADLEPFHTPLSPGDTLPLTLYVQGLQESRPDLEAVVRLVGEDGQAWAEAAGQPFGGLIPTSTWREGDELLDGHELLLPAEVPAGRYAVQVAYRLAENPSAWLALPDGSTWVTLGKVEVTAEGASR